MIKDGNKVKVVFEDGDEVRVLRGTEVRSDEHYLYLERMDGYRIRISHKSIQKIEGDWSESEVCKMESVKCEEPGKSKRRKEGECC